VASAVTAYRMPMKQLIMPTKYSTTKAAIIELKELYIFNMALRICVFVGGCDHSCLNLLHCLFTAMQELFFDCIQRTREFH